MSEDSLLGKQIDEYRFEALLGRGGMARVYRAIDTRLNRYAAIKIIDTPYRGDAEYLRRFESEAKAIARLDHANVVRLYRYGDVDGLFYMAMQYIEGADLGYVLRSYQQDGEFMEPGEVLRITQEICRALDYIHANGIIHRDVKPSNIILTKENARAVLTDFGLALRTESGTRGEVFGSPHYIAPEQAISSARAVPQSDLYAVGVMLFEMFTGQLPFRADEPMDVAMMHLHNSPPRPRSIRPELGASVEEVILKSLAKKPEDRYQTGRSLALALERALNGKEAAAPSRLTVPERVTIGLAANPLPPLPEPAAPGHTPPGHPAGGKPEGPNKVGSLADTQQLPARRPKYIWLGVGLAVTGLLCLACAALFSLALINRIGAREAGGPVTGLTPATATEAPVPAYTNTPADRTEATLPPAGAPAAASEPFTLLFLRCEEEGCLVLVNQGEEAFPLAGLRLDSAESGLRGEEWGAGLLEPGACVQAVKNENWVGQMPAGADCTPAGHVLLREGRERFWKDTFTIRYGGEVIGECARNSSRCLFQVAP